VLALDDHDRVRMVPVKLGLQSSNLVQIVSGLSEGEKVILGGQSKYQANERVRPLLAPTAATAVQQEQGGQQQ
jgi:multidrug efflux pump subunit AcrA (membrane-fusion protein)